MNGSAASIHLFQRDLYRDSLDRSCLETRQMDVHDYNGLCSPVYYTTVRDKRAKKLFIVYSIPSDPPSSHLHRYVTICPRSHAPDLPLSALSPTTHRIHFVPASLP